MRRRLLDEEKGRQILGTQVRHLCGGNAYVHAIGAATVWAKTAAEAKTGQ